MLSVKKSTVMLLVLAMSAFSASAFVSKGSMSNLARPASSCSSKANSALSERRWNFNDGQAPWGLKKNAEIWNGRVSQVAFVWVFLQELVTGKGVFKGIEEGDGFFLANVGLFGVCVVGLTGWLALKGDDDYTKGA